MSDLFNNPLPPGGPRFQNHRLRRGIYLLPSVFTVANLFCGYYAILNTLKGADTDLDWAARAIGFAVLFDAMDGFVARATGTNTEIGKQFDSLADVVSFGIAPACLAFSWGVRGILQSEEGIALQVYQLGWFVSFAFVICCAWRLARFNVQGMSSVAGAKYFIGMPTPAAAGMVAAMVHYAWRTPIVDWRWSLAWLVLVACLAALMASTVRYYSLKGAGWMRRQPSLVFVLIALLVAFIVMFSHAVLLLIASAYAISGITSHLVRVVRHRPVTHPV